MDVLVESQESYLKALRRDPVSFTQALGLYQECCSESNKISVNADVLKLNNKKDEEIYYNNNKKNGLEILLVSEFTLLEILCVLNAVRFLNLLSVRRQFNVKPPDKEAIFDELVIEPRYGQ